MKGQELRGDVGQRASQEEAGGDGQVITLAGELGQVGLELGGFI